jgi:3-dehydroquinate synthase
MKVIRQSFQVKFNYPVYFTENIFNLNNPLLRDTVFQEGEPTQCLLIIDQGLADKQPNLLNRIKNYFDPRQETALPLVELQLIPGGEEAKNEPKLVNIILNRINAAGLCRHSYIIGIGGGAVLDLVGYTAAIAHRGIRHIRIPTTVLAQNDSGIGVKNGINAFGKKNFIGTFAPPHAVINDCSFLETLEDRDWRSGIAEAIKVALIKDADFFSFIQENASRLVNRDLAIMKKIIYHCAKLHLQHIAGDDPFEMGSSRPLDFGHWASHKLEQISNYTLRHGEAVAIGIALDSIYSYLADLLSAADLHDIIQLIQTLGFKIYIPELTAGMETTSTKPDSLLSGLQEFREHLGGNLTVMMLKKIGHGIEVNHMQAERIKEAVIMLHTFEEKGLSKPNNAS